MKILYVIDHLAFGGGQMSLKTMVENMTGDVECLVCSLRNKPNEVEIGVPVIRLDSGKYNPFAFIQIAKISKKYNIDILHPQLDKSIMLCLIASFFCKSKVVIHERGGITLLKGFASFLYRVILMFLHNRASAIIANSNAMASELQNKAKIPRDGIKVIYNPVDFKIFDPENFSREISRNNLQIPPEDLVVGHVGRLDSIKGVDVLIEAFAKLLKKMPNCLLLLAGDGPQREELEELTKTLKITDKVRFLGMCSNVPEILSALDIGVITSRIKSFGKTSNDLQLNWGGRSAMEMMRMKIPIIATGKEGLSEILIDRQTALLTNVDNAWEITEAIELLSGDNELKEKLANNAFSCSKQFDAKEHIRNIRQVYKEVLSLS